MIPKGQNIHASVDRRSSVMFRVVSGGRARAHIQIVERVLERKSRACETADGACNLRIRQIALWIILSVERQDTRVLPSFLLPYLV